MIQLVYSPRWFYGKDIIIDLISITVLLLIAFFSLRSYKIRGKKNFIYLMVSFLMIAGAFLFKILTNFTIYYKVIETGQIGFVSFTYQTIKHTDTLFFIGFFLYRLLTLLGFYILYLVYKQDEPRSSIFLVFYLIIISTYFSQSAYYIFHATGFILLLLVISSYYKIYKKNKDKLSRLLLTSLIVMAVSHMISTFVEWDNLFYVFGEVVQLIGYVGLLITFILVLMHGKKKKQD